METDPLSTVSTWFEQVLIRKLTEADLRALEWEGEFTRYRQVYRNIFERFNAGLAVLWVADLPGTGVIGQVFIQLVTNRPELANGITRAYLHSFRVRPAYRNLGFGSRMLAAVEDDLRQRTYRSLTLIVAQDNPNAKRFYVRQDFRIVAEESGHWFYPDENGCWHEVIEPSWLMEKNLKAPN